MENITLEKITYKNYIKVIWELKVYKHQKKFVADNNNSLAEAYVAITNGGVALPFAICKNKKPIGFLMIGYGLSEDDDLEKEDPLFVSRRSLDRVSVPVWGTFLSEPLDIVASVGRYPAD